MSDEEDGGEDAQALVVDNGSGMVKAGFAGDDGMLNFLIYNGPVILTMKPIYSTKSCISIDCR